MSYVFTFISGAAFAFGLVAYAVWFWSPPYDNDWDDNYPPRS